MVPCNKLETWLLPLSFKSHRQNKIHLTIYSYSSCDIIFLPLPGTEAKKVLFSLSLVYSLLSQSFLDLWGFLLFIKINSYELVVPGIEARKPFQHAINVTVYPLAPTLDKQTAFTLRKSGTS